MRTRDIISGRSIGLALGTMIVMVSAGCEHPMTSTTDYQVEHRITAEERVFSLQLNLADDEQRFDPRDAANVRQFAREYLRRGRGPFLITTAEGDESASRRLFNKVAELVVGEGVQGDRVYFQVRRGTNAPSAQTRLSFSGYVVRLPDCRDWAGDTGFAPNNQPHSDFGCSYQRNFGLMLANPGDLKVSREDAVTNAVRTDKVIGTYSDGSKSFGRTLPKNEQSDFSGVK